MVDKSQPSPDSPLADNTASALVVGMKLGRDMQQLEDTLDHVHAEAVVNTKRVDDAIVYAEKTRANMAAAEMKVDALERVLAEMREQVVAISQALQALQTNAAAYPQLQPRLAPIAAAPNGGPPPAPNVVAHSFPPQVGPPPAQHPPQFPPGPPGNPLAAIQVAAPGLGNLAQPRHVNNASGT